MTRDGAIQNIYVFFRFKHMDWRYKKPLDELINLIYDDIDSASCENCLWVTEGICENTQGPMRFKKVDLHLMCNKWEKTNE